MIVSHVLNILVVPFNGNESNNKIPPEGPPLCGEPSMCCFGYVCGAADAYGPFWFDFIASCSVML